MKHQYDNEVILIRHAQSQWNRENRFTGWADPGLTREGKTEAEQAGDAMNSAGFVFDIAYSSCLQRAITTRDILLQRLGQTHIPQPLDWRLNERHYGMLQGLDKNRVTELAGEQQVWRWRRGYDDRAAPLSRLDPSHPIHDPRYLGIDPGRLPDVENLAETRDRVMAFWHERMPAHFQHGDRVLISAHGNTLRALIMALSGMTVPEVEHFEIPTGTPILYRFNRAGQPLDWDYLEPGELLHKQAG